jgi:hypothetical protein
MCPWVDVAIEVDGLVFAVTPQAGVTMQRLDQVTAQLTKADCVLVNVPQAPHTQSFLREQLSKPLVSRPQSLPNQSIQFNGWHPSALAATALERGGRPLMLGSERVDIMMLWNALPKILL